MVPPPLIVMPPKSKEFVAVKLPPPASVSLFSEHQFAVIALAVVSVGIDVPVFAPNPIGADDVPEKLNPFVMA